MTRGRWSPHSRVIAFLGCAFSADGVHTDSTAVGAHSQIPLRSLPFCDGLVRPRFLFLFYLSGSFAGQASVRSQVYQPQIAGTPFWQT